MYELESMVWILDCFVHCVTSGVSADCPIIISNTNMV